ncbi:MAG TPA: hypothetical protein VNK48_04260 [Xanthobacteraceae bacterium]|nr:hypothetical protein [Xanthobacteraceae bacterium]
MRERLAFRPPRDMSADRFKSAKASDPTSAFGAAARIERGKIREKTAARAVPEVASLHPNLLFLRFYGVTNPLRV